MINTKIYITLAIIALVSGCISKTPEYDLSPGHYTLVTDVTDSPGKETMHVEQKCTVARDGASFILHYSGTDSEKVTGTISDRNIIFTAYHNARPAPHTKIVKLRHVYEGECVAKDHARGKLRAFADTNLYMKGVWSLKKENKHRIQQ